MKETDVHRSDPTAMKQGRLTSDLIARQIEDQIRNGVWSPGDRLPSIRTLAGRFGVSVVTMAKVVRQLSDNGVLRSEPRKGVYVADALQPAVSRPDIGIEIQRSFLRRYTRPRSLSIALKPSAEIDTINLASGTMAPDAILGSAIQAAIREIASRYTERSFSTISTSGERQLREWVACHLARFGIESSPEEIVITSGSQQGRKLVADTMIEAGDTILVEQPTYPVALSTFEAAGARCVGVPVDPRDGVRLDVLEHLVDHYRPKFFYTVPTGQIPTGLTMSMAQRQRLIELAARKGFLIIESDPGNEMYYEGQAPSAIKSLDPGGLVIYLKSFSRVVAAGLRVGAAVVNGPLKDAIIDRKVTDDMVTSTLSQEVFLAYVSRPDFQGNLDAGRDHYLIRRNATMRALEATMPEGVTWTVPTSGLHTWLTLPLGLSSRLVAERAIDQGVVVAHSEIFMPNDNPDNGLRITFSDSDPDRIMIGVRRLAGVITSSLESLSDGDSRDYLVKVL